MKVARILTIIIILGSLASAGTAFYKFYIARDYLIIADVSCDSNLHSCFVGDGDATPLRYEKISKRANTIPSCNGWLDQCPKLTCEQGDSSCMVEYCQPDTGDTCDGPTSSSH